MSPKPYIETMMLVKVSQPLAFGSGVKGMIAAARKQLQPGQGFALTFVGDDGTLTQKFWDPPIDWDEIERYARGRSRRGRL
jgi:hypothetical protein